MLASGVGISLYNGWIMTLVIVGWMPFLMLGWTKNVQMRQAFLNKHQEIYEEADQKAQETLGAVKLVKQMNAEAFEVRKHDHVLNSVEDQYHELGKSFACATAFGIFALYLTMSLAFWYGSECVFGSSKCPPELNASPYTAGTVIKIFYSLLLPALSLNQLTPSI
jgi:ABC-type bacteriocin/lantibiotic exporter with double-glycine peptidase domain